VRRPANFCFGQIGDNGALKDEGQFQPGSTEMDLQVTVVLYLVAMAAVIVGVDVAFFRNRF
jgi:hypothetical protein